jgi:hypothetical protein
MNRRPVFAAFAALLFAGATAIASAATPSATQEFDIKVQLTVTALTVAEGITVTCAVGPANMAYETSTGDASNSTGKGSTHVQYSPTTPMSVVVVVTDQAGPTAGGAGGGAGRVEKHYLCWGKFDKTTTPVNFISGIIK